MLEMNAELNTYCLGFIYVTQTLMPFLGTAKFKNNVLPSYSKTDWLNTLNIPHYRGIKNCTEKRSGVQGHETDIGI